MCEGSGDGTCEGSREERCVREVERVWSMRKMERRGKVSCVREVERERCMGDLIGGVGM